MLFTDLLRPSAGEASASVATGRCCDHLIAELPNIHKALHEASVGRKNCFVEPNCATIPNTFESEGFCCNNENTYLKDGLRKEHDFEEILGHSPELLKLLDRVQAAAPTDANVLIIGETGSG